MKSLARLSAIADALALPEDDPIVRRTLDALGGRPVEVRERLVDEPAVLSRRLLFASGGEVMLRDGAVAAVLLHLEPVAPGAHGIGLSGWMPGVRDDATLADLERTFGVRPRFGGTGSWYFALDGGYARFDFRDGRGWKEPGNLVRVALLAETPGTAARPEDDDCPDCGDLLVRVDDGTGVDVDRTADALAGAVDAGRLTESLHWARLADLRPLHASGLMERVESQLTCGTCRRIICFTLYRDAPASFVHHVLNDAMRRPMEPIPPVERWGDEDRIARDGDAMHYVDHEPGRWFLVERRGRLYLDTRYVVSSMVDLSALIPLDDGETAEYRAAGREALTELAERIDRSRPHKEDSPYYARDLLRGPNADDHRAAVSAAIVNHTWIAERRRPKPPPPSG